MKHPLKSAILSLAAVLSISTGGAWAGGHGSHCPLESGGASLEMDSAMSLSEANVMPIPSGQPQAPVSREDIEAMVKSSLRETGLCHILAAGASCPMSKGIGIAYGGCCVTLCKGASPAGHVPGGQNIMEGFYMSSQRPEGLSVSSKLPFEAADEPPPKSRTDQPEPRPPAA